MERALFGLTSWDVWTVAYDLAGDPEWGSNSHLVKPKKFLGRQVSSIHEEEFMLVCPNPTGRVLIGQ